VKPEEIPANIGSVIVRGELKKWHKVTLMLDSPIGSERGGTLPLPNGARAPNLFADYRFQVDSYHAISGTSVFVPSSCDGWSRVWTCLGLSFPSDAYRIVVIYGPFQIRYRCCYFDGERSYCR
jgi:hypothetical protein